MWRTQGAVSSQSGRRCLFFAVSCLRISFFGIVYNKDGQANEKRDAQTDSRDTCQYHFIYIHRTHLSC